MRRLSTFEELAAAALRPVVISKSEADDEAPDNAEFVVTQLRDMLNNVQEAERMGQVVRAATEQAAREQNVPVQQLVSASTVQPQTQQQLDRQYAEIAEASLREKRAKDQAIFDKFMESVSVLTKKRALDMDTARALARSSRSSLDRLTVSPSSASASSSVVQQYAISDPTPQELRQQEKEKKALALREKQETQAAIKKAKAEAKAVAKRS